MKNTNPDGKVYQIRTLQDVFALPTVEHVKRCLEELGHALVVMRAQNDLMVEAARAQGQKVDDVVLEVPEVHEWTDDGRMDVDVELEDGAGNTVLKVEGREQAPGARDLASKLRERADQDGADWDLDMLTALKLREQEAEVERLRKDVERLTRKVAEEQHQRLEDERFLVEGFVHAAHWSCVVVLRLRDGFQRTMDGRALVAVGNPELRPVITVPDFVGVNPFEGGLDTAPESRNRHYRYVRTMSATKDGKPVYLFEEVV